MKKIFMLILMFFILGTVNASCSITIIEPENNFYTQETTPLFNYSVVGTNGTFLCGLVIDGVETNSEQIANNTNVSHIPAVLSHANHEWYLNCTNGSIFCLTDSRDIDIGNLQYEGMNDMRKFIEDMTGVVLVFIPLVIVIIIFSTAYYFKDFFINFAKRFNK